MSMVEKLAAHGEVNENARGITYLRERVADDGGNVTFEKVTAALQPAATILMATTDLMNDKPAMKLYLDQRGGEVFKRALGGLVVAAIEDAGARRIRPKIFETNRHAIERAASMSISQGFKIEVAPVDRRMTVVGAFSEGLTLWTQGGVEVDTTNDSDYFHRDLVAVRLVQPAVVTVYRPEAFVIVKTRGWERLRRLWWKMRFWT